MWYWLEKAVEIGHICPFLILRLDEARRTGNWVLSKRAKNIHDLYREKNYEEFEEEDKRKVKLCYNPNCSLTFDQANPPEMKKCGKCRIAAYCSRACQVLIHYFVN